MKIGMLGALLRVIILLSIFTVGGANAESIERRIQFSIPKQRADIALKMFAQQAGIQLLYRYDIASKYFANSVIGLYTPEEALEKLLDGRALKAAFTEKGDLTIQVDRQYQGGGEMNNKKGLFAKIAAVVLGLGGVVQSASVMAQTSNEYALEEVVVTAQRRVQSIQEVPISLETFTGAEMLRQGNRDLDALADMMPGFLVIPQQNDTVITIRGLGTTGNALTLEQATPIFVDGLHFGRAAMGKMAFLDIDRLEILKGPQPAYFGQNASAGAISITSMMPTPEWQGYLNSEIGNNSTVEMSFGIGGPVSETIGIRVAGKYENTAGHLRNVIDHSKFPAQEDYAGRIVLQWKPSDRFTTTAKADHMKIEGGSQAQFYCTTGASLLWDYRGPPRLSPTGGGNAESVWLDPPLGMGWVQQHEPIPQTKDSGLTGGEECFKSRYSNSQQGPYYDVPDYVHGGESNVGLFDIREAAHGWLTDKSEPFTKGVWDGILGYEMLDMVTSTLDLNYVLTNDIEVSWLTGFVKFDREASEENWNSPFYWNNQIRHEDYDQWSTELRFTSPVGGMFEWMVSASMQDSTYDINNGQVRAENRRGIRIVEVWEDMLYKNLMGTLTFNFFDNKASIDVGARYSDLSKTTSTKSQARQWVFNVEPVSQPGYVTVVNPAAEVDIYVNYDEAAGLYYYPWRSRPNAPVEWRGSAAAQAVGLSKPIWNTPTEGGPYLSDYSKNEFDPQVTLRYRPTDEHSLFLRWAQASKAGGFDTGQTSAPVDPDDWGFFPEYSETFEIGAKGNLWDGRARYDITAFELTVTDLQVTIATGNFEDPSINVNLGEQRVRGIEFSYQYAVTDRLTVGVAGAIMDGEMVYFPNAGCTSAERFTPGSDCDPVTFTIDRSGQEAPFTPDWNFVLDLDYRQPVWNDFEMSFNAKGFISDGYFIDQRGFTKDVAYEVHGDLNLAVGIGPADDRWRFSVWARNLLEATPTYRPELDLASDGFVVVANTPGDFTTYGIKFQYNYR